MPLGLRPATIRGLVFGCCLAFMVGCGSVGNLTEGPVVYGGTRHDLRYMHSDPESMVFCLYDLPFSAIFDTALLPLTGLFELVRWLSGWPPSPPY